METINNEWGMPMMILALLSVLAIFGSALWFILTAMDTNKKFRWFQIVGRSNSRERNRSGPSSRK